jgi:hypothetical protein
MQIPTTTETTSKQRKSSCLADKAKANHGKGCIPLAEEVLINKLGDLIPGTLNENDSNLELLVQRLPHPFAKQTMEALQVLVEEETSRKKKKKSKVAPCPPVEQPVIRA